MKDLLEALLILSLTNRYLHIEEKNEGLKSEFQIFWQNEEHNRFYQFYDEFGKLNGSTGSRFFNRPGRSIPKCDGPRE